jgi:2-methylcitrate dehydratase PrpD
MQQTIAQRLVDFDHELKFDRIPPEVVSKTKRLMLDTLGVCLGSTNLDFGKAAMSMVGGWGGALKSTVIGLPGKTSVHNAAFCNGILGHGQDFDDTHTESVVHPSAALVPVALAVGEGGKRRTKDVLTGLIGGLEATIRLGLPALNKFHLRGFHTTSVCATFGAAMIASKVGNLKQWQTLQAVGIGGSFASGLLECIPAKAEAKRLHAGWAGLSGIIAADLAQVGYTGPETVFEGKLGLYNSFLRGEPLDLDVIFEELGERWEVLNIRPKLYPCCHYLQAFLDCAAALRREHGVRPDQIVSIQCRIANGAVNIVCEPWASKLNPKTGYDLRFSLPFAVAVMLTKGKAGISEFLPEVLGDPSIRNLMTKVSYSIDSNFSVKDMPGSIEVILTDGRKCSWEVPQVRGDTVNPISENEILEKFFANTTFLGQSTSSRIADRILSFDRHDNFNDLMDDLRASAHDSTLNLVTA